MTFVAFQRDLGQIFSFSRLIHDFNPSLRSTNPPGSDSLQSKTVATLSVLRALHARALTWTSTPGSRARTVSCNTPGGTISLPPISSLDEGALSASRHDSTAVLRRLTLDDDGVGKSHNQPLPGIEDAEEGTNIPSHVKPTHEQLWTRRRSLSAPPLHPYVRSCLVLFATPD